MSRQDDRIVAETCVAGGRSALVTEGRVTEPVYDRAIGCDANIVERERV